MKAPIFGKNFATKLFVIIVLVTDDFLFNCKKLTDILNKKGLKDFQLFQFSISLHILLQGLIFNILIA